MFDPTEYAELNEGRSTPARPSYDVDPDRLYPDLIAHIRAALESGELPDELITRAGDPMIAPGQAAHKWLGKARKVALSAWDDALEPRDAFDDAADAARIAARAEALEVAQGWFVRALKTATGPCHIKLAKAPRWRW